MKILKQLSKFFTILFISSTFVNSAISNEPVDIWNIEKKENVIEESLLENNESMNNENIQEINILDKNKNIIINDPSNLNDIKLAGLYDPADNGLSIDMWSNSNGEEIKYFLDKLSSKKLSNFSEKILDIFLAGAIPIYSGDEDLAKKLFNPNAFICVGDYASTEACIDAILSMSSADINKMKREHMFVGGKLPPMLNVRDKSETSIYKVLRRKVRDLVNL